jgi:hypothetical protein
MKPGVDWVSIRNQYEAGIASVRKLARMHGISHTAINKRIVSHGWKPLAGGVSVPVITETTLAQHPTAPDIEAKKQQIAGHLANGTTPNMAADLADVRRETVTAWLESDTEFSELCKRAQSVWAQKRVNDINLASEKGDWRAGLALLERHPATKADYGNPKDSGGPKVEIVFNMPERKAVTISQDGTRATIE